MSKRRILIAEHEWNVADDIKSALERFGYAISSITSTGEETIKKAQEEKTDLVLMDIILGGKIDGIKAARQIHEQLNVPVVFLTMYADETLFTRAKTAEPYGYILRPFEDRELYAAIEIALSKYEVEKTLQESEWFSSSLLTNAPNPVIVINPDTSVRYVNPSLEKLTGFSSDELIGVKAPYPWWTEENLRKINRDFKKAMREGSHKLEESFQTKTGEQFWVEITSMPVKEGGELKYFLTNWVDITERKRAEEVMNQSQNELSIRNKIAEIFLAIPDEDMYGEVLQVILEAMQSQYGIFGYIDERGALIVPSLTRDIWEQCQVPDKTIEFRRDTWGGIWGRALKEKRSIYRNEGLCVPSGHLPLTKVLVVPIIYRGEVVGILEVANKPHDYVEKDRKFLESIAAYIAPILNARLQRDRQERGRKRAEIALQESDRNLKQAQHIAHVGSWVLDLKANTFTASEEMLHIYKYEDKYTGSISMEEFAQYIHPDDKERVASALQKVIAGKSPYNLEFRIIRTDGEIRVLHAQGEVIRDDSGEPVRMIGTGMDITARKRAEEALRESEEKYRLLVEYANDAICIAQDEVLKFPNPRTEEMVGYSAEELAKIPFAELIHPEDRDIILEKYRKWLKGEDLPATCSFRMFNKQGEDLRVQLNTVRISWEGRPAILNFLKDTTQQKKLEAQFIQAQKMEAIGTLAGGIAHDFNNLLMGILGFTSLMLVDIDSSHPHYDRLQGIEGLVQSGAELTKQLLGFARGGKYEVKPLDLNDILNKTSSMFGRTKKEITIYRKYQRGIWPVEADPGQLEQVLLNLYVNAWQAMPGGGELYLETHNVTLDEGCIKPYQVIPGKYVKITVTDTGIGMDEVTQQRIFEPFFTTKEMGRGTGLGLASVYGIIKNHGGYIEMDSVEGEGTTFTLYLPASERTLMEARELPRDIVGGAETVLLVDDEEVVLEIGGDMLKSLGYKALTARDGRKALEAYEKERDNIDLVILDMIMPEMDGGKVYDQLKEINPEAKVLLSSGYSIEGQAREILERGCNGFIQKPFDIRGLSNKIRDILDEK